MEHLAGPHHRHSGREARLGVHLRGQKFNASKDEPYWIVESSKTGARAAHKESALDAD
ncbi:DUF2945 domain-containing protein [Humibacillus xanthopallidus]|uniref:DUF2945 domain-containing protein n=1 Tax=Humibacillus xanthopallidus TaxID=412689 RepID=UPI0035DA5AD9